MHWLLRVATISALLCLIVIDSTAQIWSAAINIPDVTETSLNTNNYNYTMAIDTLGNIHLAWENFTQGNRGIFYSRWENSEWSKHRNIFSSTTDVTGLLKIADRCYRKSSLSFCW